MKLMKVFFSLHILRLPRLMTCLAPCKTVPSKILASLTEIRAPISVDIKRPTIFAAKVHQSVTTLRLYVQYGLADITACAISAETV